MTDRMFTENLLRELAGTDDGMTRTSESLPDRKRVIALLKEALTVLFPDYFPYRSLTRETALAALASGLEAEISCTAARDLTRRFLAALPEIRRLLLTDAQAVYEGDPAAKSPAEVMLCYPGFYAVAIYRIAHALHLLAVPAIPRIMTEYAHEKTGIDINPGAVIGEYFCIDHGTGIVIGETAVIGSHVKLYQGVTIGAKSFEKDERGLPVKGGKRHPDIGDHVIIYAGATILGGRTRIGDRAVIGGNVWLTHSVEDGAQVTYGADRERLTEMPEYVI